MRNYEVSVTNGTAVRNMDVEAENQIEAQQKALREAANRGERFGFARGTSLWIDSCVRSKLR